MAQQAAQSAAREADAALVLVVDDTPLNLDVLERILANAGYKIKTARSALQAVLELGAGVRPDLILLDIVMPDLDGYELCRQLKADPGTSRIPIIFISSRSDAADKVAAFEVGGADYVTKPFQSAEILARVKYQIKLAQLQQAIERQNEQLLKINRALVESQSQTAAVFSALSEHLVGRTLDGKYLIEEKIGSGGFGVVYRALHLTLKRPVAIKVFRPSRHMSGDENLQRFLLEGISACRVDHPNAVSTLDSGISREGIAYLVMEFLRGMTLTQEMMQKGRLPLDRCVEIIIPVCHVLAEAHAAGVIHRDIKPDNIFLHQSPSGEVVKVVDFGIAKLIGDSSLSDTPNQTLDGRIVGTPIYMAPERLRGQLHDGRADVYSVAAMFYEMLSGRLPCSDTSSEMLRVIYDQVHTPPRSLRKFDPQLPESIERVVLAALVKEPGSRPTARQFLHLIEDAYAQSSALPAQNSSELGLDDVLAATQDALTPVEPVETGPTLVLNKAPDSSSGGFRPVVERPQQPAQSAAGSKSEERMTRLARLKKEVPERLRALFIGVGSGNAATVRRVAAELAALCSALGSDELALLFCEIEKYGERNELMEVASMLSQVQQELAVFEQLLTKSPG